VVGAALPVAITALPFTRDFLFVTLPNASSGPVTVTATDAAGNEATASFDATVDLSAPSEVELLPLDPAELHPRLPAVVLRWSAPSSDPGGDAPVASYDIRYAPFPIVDAPSFEAACPAQDVLGADAVPTPGAPGSDEVFVLSGPDPRPANVTSGGTACKFATRTDGGAWHFAVRATDAAGNASAITPASGASTDALRLRYTKVTPSEAFPASGNLQRYAWSIGDVNSDGLADTAFGGRDTSGFCVVFGHAEAPGGEVPPIDLLTAIGPHHQCFLDDEPTGLGAPVIAAGDLNGDGIDDFAAGAGYFGEPTGFEAVRVYLGSETLPLDEVPALEIVGTTNALLYGVAAAGGGNFDGDVNPTTGLPLQDFIVASREESRAYVIRGASPWPKATLDLQDPADRELFGVVTLEAAVPSTSSFAFRVAFVGDALTDPDGDYDDVAITQSKGLTQVYVVKGRPTGGAATTIALSEASNGSQPGDATAVRLLQEADTNKGTFGFNIQGKSDYDMDGIPEVLANHPSNERLHLFFGAALDGALGTAVRVDAAGAAPTADGVIQGAHGNLYVGAFDSLTNAGNFDGDPLGTPDLVMGLYDLFITSYGEVRIRMNQSLDGDPATLGLLPYEDITIAEPVPMTTPDAFAPRVAAVPDFNGDGFPDLIVGTIGQGWALLVY
jgi:hypothetical protein